MGVEIAGLPAMTHSAPGLIKLDTVSSSQSIAVFINCVLHVLKASSTHRCCSQQLLGDVDLRRAAPASNRRPRLHRPVTP